MSNPERARYSNYVKEQVRKRYRLCRTTEDKEKLADELGIGSVPKLYNLASRLNATGKESNTEVPSWSASQEEMQTFKRENPDTVVMTPSEKKYLMSEFSRRTPEAISYHLHHTETAIAYWARHLGLRLPAKHWNIVKVSQWFGMSLEEFRELNVDIYPLGNRQSKLILEVVSTTSLGRWMKDKQNMQLLKEKEADEFFIREILESIEEVLEEKTNWEKCKFLTHGHVCQNSYSITSYGLFCPNSERYDAGDDPLCNVKHLSIEDLRPKTE